MLRDALAGDVLSGVHERLVRGQFCQSMLPAYLVDEPDHLQANVQVGGEVQGIRLGKSRRFFLEVVCRLGGSYRQRQAAGGSVRIGDGDLSRALRPGHRYPIGQDPLQGDSLRVAGFGDVLRSDRSDDEAASFACLQGIALVAAHPDLRVCRQGRARQQRRRQYASRQHPEHFTVPFHSFSSISVILSGFCNRNTTTDLGECLLESANSPARFNRSTQPLSHTTGGPARPGRRCTASGSCWRYSPGCSGPFP